MGRYLDICKEIMRDRWAKQAAALLAQVQDNDLRADLRDHFEERAGICEYDGGSTREIAEQQAYLELVRAVDGHER